MYVMLSGTMPFYGRDKAEVYRNTCSGAYAVDGPEFAQISHANSGESRVRPTSTSAVVGVGSFDYLVNYVSRGTEAIQ